MLSWMLSVPRKATEQLIGQKRSNVHHLLRALKNEETQDLSDPRRLLRSVASSIRLALDASSCIIWLRVNPSRDDTSSPAWIGARPPPYITCRSYKPRFQRGVLRVTELRDRLLQIALQEVGIHLVIAIDHQNELFGWLGVGPPRQGQVYSLEQQCFLGVIANQAALAINNFCLKTKLETSIMQLRKVYQQAVQAQEHERRQLAETLHDETLQHLADISVRLGLICKQAEISPIDLDDLQVRLAEADCRLREIVRGVHPSILFDLGLIEAVIAFLETLSLKSSVSPIQVELSVVGFKDQRLPNQEIELALYRFLQNAITNALIHGKPNHINLEIKWGLNSVEVKVDDDGCGMDTTVEEAARAGHFGLLTMRERIEAFGGKFVLSSRAGQGTLVIGCIHISVPTPAPGHVEDYTVELT